MAVKLPLISMTASQPLWMNDPDISYPNDSIHRGDYKGHFHASRRQGFGRLTAKSYKPKVSAYLSSVNVGSQSGPGSYTEARPPPPVMHYWTKRGGIVQENNALLENRSSYKSDFVEKEINPVPIYVPRHTALTSEKPFLSKSTYKDHYSSTGNENALVAAGGGVVNKPVLWRQADNNVINWTSDDIGPQDPYMPQGRAARRFPFPKETSYTAHYPKHSAYTRQPPILPIQSTMMEPTRIAACDPKSTDYQDNFKAKPLPHPDPYDAKKRKNSRGYTGVSTGCPHTDTLVPYVENQQPCFYVANNPQ